MDFFTKVDQSTLVEQHIRKVTGLEMEQGRRLALEYSNARRVLKERIASARFGSFTDVQAKIVLAQLETALKELDKRLSPELALGVEIAADQSIDDLLGEIKVFSKDFEGIRQMIPVDVIIESMDSKNLLLNRFQASIEAYNQSIRDNIQRELTQSLIAKTSYFHVVERIDELLGLEEWKAARIARTELHNVYNASKQDAMGIVKNKYIPNLQKALIHPMDSRTGDDSKYLSKMNAVVDLTEPFRYEWMGKERIFFYPPDRPNDRAILAPYRKEWNN